MPYFVYEYSKKIQGGKATAKLPSSTDYVAIPLADGKIWLARRDGGGRGDLSDNATLQQKNEFTKKEDVEMTDEELRKIAEQKKQREDGEDGTALTKQEQAFQPMSYGDVVARLETAFLQAQSAQQPDTTRINTALKKLQNFIKRTQGHYDSSTFSYKLEHSFVGETAHIRAARILHPDQLIMKTPGSALSIKYKLVSRNPNLRFRKFMEKKVEEIPFEKEMLIIQAKTDINEELIAPRTIVHQLNLKTKDPAMHAHNDILEGFLDDLPAARRQELADWVQRKIGTAAKDAPRRIGIWIRKVVAESGDTHTLDQNMSKERFQKILQAAKDAGIAEIIILGDGWEPNWHKFFDKNSFYNFTQIWAKNMPDLGSHGQKELQGGYAEQVAIYTALYREQNMDCIVGNKSGGMDLPSLAGVPQIQIAEMAPKELMVHHRMGFQAMCSPFWTVVRADQRQNGELMDLTSAQQANLTDCIRRAQRVRQWHFDSMGGIQQWASWKLPDKIHA